MDQSHVTAELLCSECEHTCVHELSYAGRLLVSTLCSNCGHRESHDTHGGSLRTDYLRDFEQRLITKPLRMGRRFARHPVTSALGLPLAVVRKPVRMLAELQALRRNR